MCLKKVPVYHKNDGTYTYHKCGKCIECLNLKSMTYANLLERQFDVSRTQEAFLVTLKYNNKNVPLVRVHRKKVDNNVYTRKRLPFPDEKGNKFYNEIEGFKEYESVVFMLKNKRLREYFDTYIIDSIDAFTEEQKKYLDHLLKPITTGKVRGTKMAKTFIPKDHFPILFHHDVQLYVKRVRDKIHTALKQYYKQGDKKHKLNDYEKEKIRIEMSRVKVFYTGEYGPQSFRPHYHLLIFFDSPRISAVLQEILSSTWSLGSVDVEQCDSAGAGRYVSEYCNSVVGLPPLYKFAWNKTKANHSIRIGINESKELNANIQEVTFESIKQEIIRSHGGFKPSTYPLSLENYLFPKTYRYSQSTDNILLARYTLYDAITTATGLTKVSDIISYYCDEKIGVVLSQVHPFFPNSVIFFESDNMVSCLRSILYTSRRFLKNCTKFKITPYNYLRLIRNYHDDKNTFTMQQWYKMMEEDSKIIKPQYLANYYDNLYKDDIVSANTDYLLELLAEQLCVSFDEVKYALNHENHNAAIFDRRLRQEFVINKKIKHKKLNDKNIDFIVWEKI